MDSPCGDDDCLWEYPEEEREEIRRQRQNLKQAAQDQSGQKTTTSARKTAPKAKPLKEKRNNK